MFGRERLGGWRQWAAFVTENSGIGRGRARCLGCRFLRRQPLAMIRTGREQRCVAEVVMFRLE